MKLLSRYFVFDLCLQLKRIKWNSEHAERLADAISREDRK